MHPDSSASLKAVGYGWGRVLARELKITASMVVVIAQKACEEVPAPYALSNACQGRGGREGGGASTEGKKIFIKIGFFTNKRNDAPASIISIFRGGRGGT